MNINSALRSSSSGLYAERMRLDTISANIANANSVSTPETEAYRRKVVVLQADENGVTVEKIIPENIPLRSVNEPDHPMADSEGNVEYSNVNPVMEMVNMMSATRAYEANVAAFNSAKGMIQAALSIGRI
jgi:flagellar basal-body rod protein FlgC